MTRPKFEIETLGLSVRSTNILLRSGYLTKASLEGITEETLLGLKNCGITSAKEILKAIEGLNVSNSK